MYDVLNLFWCGRPKFLSKMMNFVAFFKQQYYFVETFASVAELGFADFVAGVGNGVDNGWA